MTLTEAMGYINSIGKTGSILGLERIEKLMFALGNPQDTLKFVHIAGTNGKGSAAAMTASILTAAGYKTGLYTSPYLYRFNERIEVDGQEIPDADLVRLTEKLMAIVETMDEKPTVFEFVTAMGFVYFAEQHCDMVVLEVGLGGRFDATNIIKTPEVCAIMSIGLDHTELLGDTIEKIAAEKAGIVKPNAPVVMYAQSEQAENVVKDICVKNNTPFMLTRPQALTKGDCSLNGQEFSYRERKQLYIHLAGEYQVFNAAVVLDVIDVLRSKGYVIPEDALRRGLTCTIWPGRFEVMSREPLFIVDGAHNPDGVKALKGCLEEYFKGQKLTFVMGVMADKDFTDMIKEVVPFASSFVCVTPGNSRALPSNDLKLHIETVYKGEVIDAGSVENGIRYAQRLKKAACAFGSLYMVGKIREYFGLYTKVKEKANV